MTNRIFKNVQEILTYFFLIILLFILKVTIRQSSDQLM